MANAEDHGEVAARQIALEQEHIDVLYRRLDEVRDHVAYRLQRAIGDPIAGTPGSLTERDAMVAAQMNRLTELNGVDERLCFGRLDLLDGDTAYVGRIGLFDEFQNSLMMDWRADASAPFYQATAAAPKDVVRRRNVAISARTVTAIDDDVLILDALSDETRESVTGNDSLITALDSARTGHMRDIVSTIQAEQDIIIRSDAKGVLVVEGGPGTGKTVVALHRVAYLLYAHRDRISRSGALIIGPNPAFLHYIDQVLPALGETGVVLVTLGDLYPGVCATALEAPAAAELKGNIQFAEIIRRAVRNRSRVPDADLVLKVDGNNITLSVNEVRAAIKRAQDSHRPYNKARAIFTKDLLARLAAKLAESLSLNIDQETQAGLIDDLRHSPDVRREINLCWMPQSPEQLLADLFASPDRLLAAAPALSPRDRELLIRDRSSEWTISDVPLLDEAADLLGDPEISRVSTSADDQAQREREVAYARDALSSSGMAAAMITAEQYVDRFATADALSPLADRAVADRTWAYGHVVVDEAQELTAMQWRMVMRRSPSKSMTIVGDPAQASAPGAIADWSAALEPSVQDRWRKTVLSINYRTPQAIMNVAAELLRVADIAAQAPRSVREGKWPVQLRLGAAPGELAAVISEEAAVIGYGTIGVVVGRSRLVETAALVDELSGGDPRFGEGRVTVETFTIGSVKGLEFDTVILVDPQELISESVNPAHDLYVGLTRPTQRLVIVSGTALPPLLAEALAAAELQNVAIDT
jgi:DNA helicase IV